MTRYRSVTELLISAGTRQKKQITPKIYEPKGHIDLAKTEPTPFTLQRRPPNWTENTDSRIQIGSISHLAIALQVQPAKPSTSSAAAGRQRP